MKKLQNNFTTPEQIKRLLELGIPAWTADCYYYDMFDKHTKVSYIDANKDYKWNLESEYAPKPCWSVGRLIEIYRLCDIIGSQWIIKGGYSEPLIECIITNIEYQIKNEELDFSKLEE